MAARQDGAKKTCCRPVRVLSASRSWISVWGDRACIIEARRSQFRVSSRLGAMTERRGQTTPLLDLRTLEYTDFIEWILLQPHSSGGCRTDISNHGYAPGCRRYGWRYFGDHSSFGPWETVVKKRALLLVSGTIVCCRNSQMGRDRYRCLHLLQPIVEIHVSNSVLWRVVVWIAFALVTLDLQTGWYSLLTEGNLISSATADDELRRQVKLVCPDGLAHHLCQSH